jgi:hypothetical protein
MEEMGSTLSKNVAENHMSDLLELPTCCVVVVKNSVSEARPVENDIIC